MASVSNVVTGLSPKGYLWELLSPRHSHSKARSSLPKKFRGGRLPQRVPRWSRRRTSIELTVTGAKDAVHLHKRYHIDRVVIDRQDVADLEASLAHEGYGLVEPPASLIKLDDRE